MTFTGERKSGQGMAIFREVRTEVYCDICGEYVIGWKSPGIGVSRSWAAYFAREKDMTDSLTTSL